LNGFCSHFNAIQAFEIGKGKKKKKKKHDAIKVDNKKKNQSKEDKD